MTPISRHLIITTHSPSAQLTHKSLVTCLQTTIYHWPIPTRKWGTRYPSNIANQTIRKSLERTESEPLFHSHHQLLPPAFVDNHVLATLCYRCGPPRRRHSGHCPRFRHFHCSPYDFYLFVTPPSGVVLDVVVGSWEDAAVGAGCEDCSWSLRLT